MRVRRAPTTSARKPMPVKTCRRRLTAMLALLAVAFVALGGRLAQLQGVGPDRYVQYGESQLVQRIERPAPRGAIFDRNGRELALSIQQSTVWANPRVVTDPAGQAAALSPVLGVDVALLQDRLSRDAAFVYLARTVPDAVAEQVKGMNLPGIFLTDEPKRFMPAGDLAAPLIGKVGIDNQGLGGVELQFEDLLSGAPGERIVERAPDGTDIVLRKESPAVPGDDLVLTIDRALQHEAERSLAAMIQSASAMGGIAIVMDSQTGEVLADANLVTDPADGSIKPAQSNHSVTRVYEPGSVNKLITIAAALEEGLYEPASKLAVTSTIKVADHVFKEHDPHPTVDWTITDIMANSSNVGSIMIGQKLGKQKLDAYLRDFGFGEKTGLGFPGESRGLMLDPKKWSGTSIGTIPIGQGIAVTAMQMLAAYNTIANGGEYVAPKLVKATVDSRGEEKPTKPSERRRVVSDKTAREITAMLNEVVRVGTGTKAAIDGYTVAGKTGTARKPLEGARGYKAGAYVSSFAGFVPAEKPALTAIVMLDEPTPIYGGLVAAPVFAEITRYGLRQLRIPPPPQAPIEVSVPTADPEAAKAAEPGAANMTVPTTAPAAQGSTTTVPAQPPR